MISSRLQTALYLGVSLLAGLSSPVYAQSCDLLNDAPSKEWITQMDEIFHLAFYSREIYRPNKCYVNVQRLYETFHHHFPELQPQDFKVLLLTSERNIIKEKSTIKRMRVSEYRHRYRNQKRSNLHAILNYHFVLKIRGRIYDLDYTDEPRPLSASEYGVKFFDQRRFYSALDLLTRAQAVVIEIPGEDYLTEKWDRDPVELFDRYPSVPAKEYFNR